MKQQASASTETQNKGRDIIDYSGKLIYVGIDVHEKDYQVAKVLEGIVLGNHRMSSDSQMLVNHLRGHYPGAAFKCVYESCSWGFNLQRALEAAGMECIVVHAADVSTNDKERRRKTDKVDACKLAFQLASGNLKAIYVPDEEHQKERNLVRYRKRLSGDINRTKNRLKSLLKYQGISIPDSLKTNNWSKKFLAWVDMEIQKDETLGITLSLMLEQVKALRQLLLKTERSLRDLRKKKYEDSVGLALSVAGIGPTTAMLFLLEVGDITRFKGFDALNDFIGFCPDTNSSGDIHRDTGITTRRHKQLRSMFIECAWKAVRSDPALLEYFSALRKRMPENQAIIRIARKLLRRLRAVLLSGQPYQKGVIA